MGLQSVNNNAKGTLASSISSGSISIILGTGQGALFPASDFRITLKDYTAGVLVSQEVVNITSRTGDTLTVLSRAAEACPRTATSLTQTATAYAFNVYVDALNGTIIEQDFTASMHNSISSQLDTLTSTKLDVADYLSGAKLYATSTTGTDAYAATITGITSYAQINGQAIRVKVDVTNTGAATMNINALGAKSIVKTGSFALEDLDIRAGQIIIIARDNAQDAFELKDAIGAAPVSIIQTVASETLVHSADTVQQTLSNTFAKTKEIRARTSGTIRVKFDMKKDSYPLTTAQGQVYLNGVAAGTLQSTSSASYITYSEDFYIVAGTLVQLYIKLSAAGSAPDYGTYRNFRIYYDKSTVQPEADILID